MDLKRMGAGAYFADGAYSNKENFQHIAERSIAAAIRVKKI
jgi:hypothetical protein